MDIVSTILIIGSDEGLSVKLKLLWPNNALKIIKTNTFSDLADFIGNKSLDFVFLTSSRCDPKDELHCVKKIRGLDRTLPIILMARQSSENLAIEAFRAGVTDYFRIPFSEKKLIDRIKVCLVKKLSRQVRGANAVTRDRDHPMIGVSKALQEIRDYLKKVALTDSTVLITGETGTGKGLAAQIIHNCSSRKKYPFVCVNCAALPENLVESELFGYERGAFTGAVGAKPGKFELATGGSIFLDEIGEMNPYAQAKVLRTIENKEIARLGSKAEIPLDLRVIVATNRDPEELVRVGKFREDLYYRLNVVRIHIPALRERKDDIPHLVDHAIRNLNNIYNCNITGMTEDAFACIMRYDWPGNVRELLNILEAIYVNPPRRQIALAHFPKPFREKLKSNGGSSSDERRTIVSTLIKTDWNKTTAAHNLNCSRMTLYRKIKKYNIIEKRDPSR